VDKHARQSSYQTSQSFVVAVVLDIRFSYLAENSKRCYKFADELQTKSVSKQTKWTDNGICNAAVMEPVTEFGSENNH
jgi:hypothetical protein